MAKIRKGICHVHTNYSYDAQLCFDQYRELARERDLSFILLTEHFDTFTPETFEAFKQDCHNNSSAELLFIPGIEYAVEDPFHILGIGIEKYQPSRNAEEIIDLINQNGGFSSYAHPIYQRFKFDTRISKVNAIEVQNSKYDGSWVPRLRSYKLWKKYRGSNPNILLTSGTDYHRTRDFKSATYFFIEAEVLTQHCIMKNMKAGNYQLGRDNLKYSATHLSALCYSIMYLMEYFILPIREKYKSSSYYLKKFSEEIFIKKNFSFILQQIKKKIIHAKE